MSPKDIQDIVALMERAPLANMHEAKAVAQLIDRFVQHFSPKAKADAPPTA